MITISTNMYWDLVCWLLHTRARTRVVNPDADEDRARTLNAKWFSETTGFMSDLSPRRTGEEVDQVSFSVDDELMIVVYVVCGGRQVVVKLA